MTALHFAIIRYKENEVVRDILMGINSELLETAVDMNGRNPAHFAAVLGNTEALKIMLDSNPKCLFIPDNQHHLAIDYALAIPALNKTSLYLFKQMKSYTDGFGLFLRSNAGFNVLLKAIDAGLIGMYAF